MDFTVIKRAGLTQSEFALLAGVSRVTTNMWVTGKMAPHRFIKDRVAAVIDALETAIKNEKLPLSKGVARHNRAAELRTLVPAE